MAVVVIVVVRLPLFPLPRNAEEESFFKAIHENPKDDTPRLIYADWLDDQPEWQDGQVGTYTRERAEFIRLQCRHGSDDVVRMMALYCQHCDYWFGYLPMPRDQFDVRRGFPERR